MTNASYPHRVVLGAGQPDIPAGFGRPTPLIKRPGVPA